MDWKVWSPIIISGFSLLVSGFNFYKSYLSRFKGDISVSNKLLFMQINKIPSLGITIFLQNNGAKAGRLDDLRLHLKQIDAGSDFDFYPHVMSKEYNRFRSFDETIWNDFSPIQIQPVTFPQQFILFKPKNDKFTLSEGKMVMYIEVKWNKKKEWKRIKPISSYTLTKEVANLWSDPSQISFTILSDEASQIRVADGKN